MNHQRSTARSSARKGERSQIEHANMHAPARFEMLYESRDGRLCFFQNHEGHLTAVNAARLYSPRPSS